ncbi:hypothetical protein GXW78_18205 [Roseomonas terrae]|uniref:Uncharacterized protein n=1 Tax=Neoroseomonas terrae TaxID=424799 RepID=A0ABS5EKQ0_9PROT|nr:hypothetical protein [Neoroseomonas terrae]MBR0651609.1 hypothetical protein [Neoroseomonas terrae]
MRLEGRKPNEPTEAPAVGLALAEARALGAAIRLRAQAVARLDQNTLAGAATIAVAVGGLAGGVGMLAVALAQAGRLDAAQRVAEACNGLPREVLAALADRTVSGALE